MAFLIFGFGCCLLSMVAFVFVLVHAFKRSIGTGVMVLFIPFYNLYYAFAQFEHRQKGLIVGGCLGFLGLGIVFLAMGTAAIVPAPLPVPG
jgi:translocator protein